MQEQEVKGKQKSPVREFPKRLGLLGGDVMYSLTELAKTLGVSTKTIHRLVDCRNIAFYRIRDSIRFLRKDVEHYLNEHKVDVVE